MSTAAGFPTITPEPLAAPEAPERVHWDEASARTVGMSGAYDCGPERVAWLGHVATNWMGNDGQPERLSAQVRRHNLIGDVTWCRGIVTAEREEAGLSLVDVDLVAENQRSESTARGSATAAQPRGKRS